MARAIDTSTFIEGGYIHKNYKGVQVTDYASDLSDSVKYQHTTETIVKARLTQNKFRKALLDSRGKCQICGIDIPELLIASHIKPWAISDDDEKVDVNNGLLLCANHDRLFDRNLISFDKEGKLIISNLIDKNSYEKLNLSPKFTLTVSEESEKYLHYHRKRMTDEN